MVEVSGLIKKMRNQKRPWQTSFPFDKAFSDSASFLCEPRLTQRMLQDGVHVSDAEVLR